MEDDDVDSSEVQAPPFLAHLGLDGQADERAIRRAYAQRLKRIDQIHEAQAFQDLREAYETALRWCAWQRQRAAEREADQAVEQAAVPVEATLELVRPADAPRAEPASQPLAPPPSDALPDSSPAPALLAADGGRAVFEAPPDPEVLAEAVFGGFVARRDQGFASEDEAQQALDQALADDRLVNLEARAMFEWRVACLLAEGWRPGHEFVFSPACKTFHWEQERRALAVFGRVGAVLNAAIQERLMFFGQGPLEFNAQRQLIQRLRRDEMPDPGELMRTVPTMRMLAQRYPQWLRMITSQDNFVRWSQAYEAVPASQREAHWRRAGNQPAPMAAPTRDPFQKQQSSFSPWWLVFAVVLIFGVFSRQTKAPVPPLSSAPWSTPAQAPSQSGGFKPLYDLSPTDPVVTRPAERPRGQAVAPTRLPTPAASDLNQRQALVEAELQKVLAEPADKAQRDPGDADASAARAASRYLERQRKFQRDLDEPLPELGGSVLSTSPESGTAPKLSYDLTQPADAASAVPDWKKPPTKF